MRVKVKTELKKASSRNFCSEIGLAREERAVNVIYHISDSKDSQKQKQIGSMTKTKWKFVP